MDGIYKRIGTDIGMLVDSKNAAYGDSFRESGKVIRIIYPNGINSEQCDEALVMVRIIDKLFRIANKKDAFGENPWMDIAGYAILMCRVLNGGPEINDNTCKSDQQNEPAQEMPDSQDVYGLYGA